MKVPGVPASVNEYENYHLILEFKWGAYLANVQEVKDALAGEASCSQQTPLNTACLDSQYDKLTQALPAAMRAAAAPAAQQAVGEGAQEDPEHQANRCRAGRCQPD